jgi:putative ABC transport system permease protein
MTRPNPKFAELRFIKDRTDNASHSAYIYFNESDIEYQDAVLTNVSWYGVTDEYTEIQPLDISFGRYLVSSEFTLGSPVMIMGYTLAEKMFDEPSRAVGKMVTVKGHKVQVVGVIKKQGNSLLGGWDYDHIVIMPYRFCNQIGNPNRADGFIMVEGKTGIPVDELKGELEGVMRSIRRLNPKQDDNFSLNDITSGTSQLASIFAGMTIGGFAITVLSFVVGIFGVANIMFVTVRERTSIIGLKKAIGAKRRTILMEFLIESAFLCLFGGMIGVVLVFLLTFALTYLLNFSVSVSFGLFLGAVLFCIFTGMLAGIIPASIAARMDPVVAIRSK